MKKQIVCTGLVLAVASLVFLNGSRAQQPPEARPAPPSFKAKYVYVQSKSNPETAVVLESAQIQTVGAEPFLTGTAAFYEDAWSNGLRHWLPMDDVAAIIEIDDMDDFKRRLEKAQEAEANAKEARRHQF
jgi:hypothetical protein